MSSQIIGGSELGTFTTEATVSSFFDGSVVLRGGLAQLTCFNGTYEGGGDRIVVRMFETGLLPSGEMIRYGPRAVPGASVMGAAIIPLAPPFARLGMSRNVLARTTLLKAKHDSF